jgi:hypothetical protein
MTDIPEWYDRLRAELGDAYLNDVHVHHLIDHGARIGMSERETLLALARHLSTERRKVMRILIDRENLRPPPPIVLCDCPKSNELRKRLLSAREHDGPTEESR